MILSAAGMPVRSGASEAGRLLQRPDQRRLREVCIEFEGAMTAAMFKQGLKAAVESIDSDDSEQSSQAYMGMAMDHLAYYLGRQGMLGLADMLTKELAGPNQEQDDSNGHSTATSE